MPPSLSTVHIQLYSDFQTKPIQFTSVGMIQIVDVSQQVEKLQDRFRENLVAEMEGPWPNRLGWQGGGEELPVYYHPIYDFWAAFQNLENRYWNAFGWGDPRRVNSSLSIVVEINPPRDSIDRRIAGAFGRDEDGDPYLLHRGKVGGGRKGIGKEAFINTYPGSLLTVQDGAKKIRLIVISALESEHLSRNISNFISQVEAFKESVSSGRLNPDDIATEDAFTPEFEGQTYMPVREQVGMQCRHGSVVRELRDWLGERGVHTANDGLRDLYIRDSNGDYRAIFEIKTSADRQSVYKAVGQLTMYTPVEMQTRKIVVLPADADEKWIDSLNKRSFEVVRYEWVGSNVVFTADESLDRILEAE